MSQINLTFNKPAQAQFFQNNVKGVKVQVREGQLVLKAVDKETGPGIYPLHDRTRGGSGITVSGRMVNSFLTDAKIDRGTHMVLEQGSYKRIVAKVHNGPTEKPSKLIPTARLWRVKDEVISKASDAPKKIRKTRTPKATDAGTQATA